MKSVLCLAALAVLAATSATVVRAPTVRSNLNVGNVTLGDRLLYRAYVNQTAVTNAVQNQDVIFQGNLTTRISAVVATEIGGTQNGAAWVLSGGLGQNNVTVRFQSARGSGLLYLFDIWSR